MSLRNNYMNYKNKRHTKRRFKEHDESYKKNKNNNSMKNINIVQGLFRILGSFGGIPAILLIIFFWFRWREFSDFIKGIFKVKTDFFNGNINELPNDRDYYLQVARNLNDSMNLLDVLDIDIYNIISELNVLELQYVADTYGREYPLTDLIKDIKREINLEMWISPLGYNLNLYFKERFEEANIPY